MKLARLPLLSLLSLLGAARAAAGVSLVYEVTPAPNAAVRVTERFGRDASVASALPLLPAPHDALRRWIEDSASAVAGYYGKLPVPRVTVTLVLTGRGAVGYGVTHGTAGGARIDLNIGPELAPDDIAEDWVLTHELVHTALPRMPRGATWLDEGLATYVEPIARVRRGLKQPEKVWAELAWGLPKGLPQAGDEGLDRTHTWGRTYWGGALFCFVADVELRERTQNRMSLREALIGVLEAGGNVTGSWGIDDVLAAMDRATGTTVLSDLHARMGTKAVDPDLPALFARLGVSAREGRVTYDDAAPLAALRKTLPAGAVAPRAAATRTPPES